MIFWRKPSIWPFPSSLWIYPLDIESNKGIIMIVLHGFSKLCDHSVYLSILTHPKNQSTNGLWILPHWKDLWVLPVPLATEVILLKAFKMAGPGLYLESCIMSACSTRQNRLGRGSNLGRGGGNLGFWGPERFCRGKPRWRPTPANLSRELFL